MTTSTTSDLHADDLIIGTGLQATGPGQFVTVHDTGLVFEIELLEISE